VLLIHGQVLGATIDLARAREYQLWPAVESTTGFEERELRPTIDLKICQGIFHAVQMTHLASQIENVVLTLYQVCNAVGIANICDVDVNSLRDRFQIEGVPPISWN
jgi:hypothetical protein